MEQTFVIIKPDAIQRKIVGEIISRFERKGLKIVALNLILISKSQAEELYSIHKTKPFYSDLIKFITSSPVIVSIIEGRNAVIVVRKLLGATFGYEAEPGTIRGDFGLSKDMNLVHASDSLASAQREIKIFFEKDKILTYKTSIDEWI